MPHTHAIKNYPRTQDKEGWSFRAERKGRLAKQLQPRSTKTARHRAHSLTLAGRTHGTRTRPQTYQKRTKRRQSDTPGQNKTALESRGQLSSFSWQYAYTTKPNKRCTLLPAVCIYIYTQLRSLSLEERIQQVTIYSMRSRMINVYLRAISGAQYEVSGATPGSSCSTYISKETLRVRRVCGNR